MRCSEVENAIETFLDGTLAPHIREEVERHLDSCAGCRQTLDRRRRLTALLQSVHVPPVPGAFADAVMARALRVQASRPACGDAWLQTFAMRAAAAAMLFIGLGTGAFMALGLREKAPGSVPFQPTLTETYNLEALSDAPDGSLSQAYLVLADAGERKSR